MNASLDTLKPGLAVIVATLTGLDLVSVEQEQGRNSWGKVTARYSLIGWAGLGVDDSTFDRVPEGDEQPFGETPYGGASPPMRETVSGRRTFTLRIKVVCFDHTGGSEAKTYTERARTRLRWGSITQAFNLLGIGFDKVLSSGVLTDTSDERISSTAYIDVGLSLHVRDTDPTEYASIDAVDTITIKKAP